MLISRYERANEGGDKKRNIKKRLNEIAALVLVVQERQRELDFIKGRLH